MSGQAQSTMNQKSGLQNALGLPGELFRSRHLIWKLARNDFKKRYAGSYLGTVWALVQPVITILLYYIVFGRIFPNQRSSGSEIPFVVFLTAGLVPWFYFSDALTGGTNALIEYNYLVKKVVFKISILPVIKLISATFVHLFFIFLLLVLSGIYGYYPSLYTIQIIYYSLCVFLLSLALNFTTCAVTVFFRDMAHIISIALQLGMWATPIMWDIHALQSPKVIFLLKLNPVEYIVSGYRDAVYGRVWFWEKVSDTLYFWGVVLLLFALGTFVFKKLKPHFADIL